MSKTIPDFYNLQPREKCSREILGGKEPSSLLDQTQKLSEKEELDLCHFLVIGALISW